MKRIVPVLICFFLFFVCACGKNSSLKNISIDPDDHIVIKFLRMGFLELARGSFGKSIDSDYLSNALFIVDVKSENLDRLTHIQDEHIQWFAWLSEVTERFK